MKKRGIILVFILITFLFVVSGCSSGSNDVSKAYDQALRDLKNGRYTEAADTLATISFYEDSLQLSQYCRAQALAEEEKYSDALAVLQNLGDYRDSVQCCEYFRARMMETISTDAISQAQAALFYDNVEYGFRDAAIRAETIRSTLYLKGTEAEENGEWDYSSYVFSALENYKDSQTRRHYVTGRGLEAKGSDETIQYAEAIKEYEYSISYEDSKDRIQSCIDAVYREAERDITSQEFEKAETLYLALGDHCDKEKFTSLKAAKESFAEKLIEAGEFDKAKDIYLSLGEKEKATGTIYKKAMYLEQNGEIRLAATLFLSINDYLDSREKHYALGTEQITNDLVMASAILLEDKKYKDSEDQLYQIADEASAKGQYTLSISVFNELGNTRDCRLRMTNDLYLYGMSLLANGQNDEAAAVFDKIYGFGSAVLYANMARYAAAEKLQERELFSKAAEAFEQIEDYEDAKSRAVECRYKDGLQKKNNTDYVTAIAVFDGLGNYKDSKEEKTECNYLLAVQHQNNKKWENAVRIFEELADYSDSEERCIVCWDNIGEEQLNNNRAEDAYYSFIKARNENGQERAALAIADNYLANMNLEKALTWYRKATTLKETEIRTAGIAQSLLNVEEDDLSEQFASVIPGSEKCKDIFYALAIRSMERQDEDSAMRQMQKAGDTVETSEKFRDMLNARVDALVSNGQYDEAAALCVSNGDSVQADRLLAEKIKKDEEKKKKEEAEKQKQHQSRIDEANELVKREEYEAAIKILTEIDETKLAEKVILQKNAAEEAKRKEEEEAERLRYQAREEVGKNLLEKGEYDAAYSVFKEIDNQELMSESIYQKAEKLDQPELYLTILDYKDSQEKHYLTGKALLETDPERAFRILSEDINYSDSQTLLYDLANLESGKENYKLSYVIFDFLSQQPLDTVNLRPDCHMRAVQDCYKYGLALLRQGDWESAAKIFKAQGDLSLAADHEKEAQYARAMEFEEKGEFRQAAQCFEKLGAYSDSIERAVYNQYRVAKEEMETGKYEKAQADFQKLGNYSDSAELVKECKYQQAMQNMKKGNYTEAKNLLDSLNGYSDSAALAKECRYQQALQNMEKGNYIEAQNLFVSLKDYSDSIEKSKECVYQFANSLFEESKYQQAVDYYLTIDDYRDANIQIVSCYVALGDQATEKAKDQLQKNQIIEAIEKYIEAYNLYRIAGTNDKMLSTALMIGSCYQASNNLQEAINWYKLDGTYGQNYMAGIVKYLIDTEQYDEAEDILLRINIDAELSKAFYFRLAEMLQETGDEERALRLYEKAGDYSDAASRHSDVIYEQANTLEEEGEYRAAAEIFASISEYKDAADRRDNAFYKEADMLEGKHEYKAAAEIFASISEYNDASERRNGAVYSYAETLVEQRLLSEAAEIFDSLGDYSDAAARAKRINDLMLKAGETVLFGQYEQDNNMEDGSEAIEWIVLDVNADKALLLASYGLETEAYHSQMTSINWEKSKLREWLNHDFINVAFTEEEQAAIMVTSVDNSSEQGYGQWEPMDGKSTDDKVFLLSYEEANKYLGLDANDNVKTRLAPTDHVIAKGVLKDEGYTAENGRMSADWWLRSPGINNYSVACVNAAGFVTPITALVETCCIRPALWIDMEVLDTLKREAP